MKMKKLVSAIAALALSVSAFAGIGSAADPILTVDFDTTSITSSSNGNKTVWTVAEAQGTALTTATLKLGSSGSGSKYYLGYDAALGTVGTGAVTLSYDFEQLQIRSDKNASIKLAFADSENTEVLGGNVSTGKTASFAAGSASASTSYGAAYKVKCDFNFYNGTANVSILNADGSVLAGPTAMTVAGKDISKIYLADTNWQYGYVLLDNITLTPIEGVDTTFTVTGTNNEVIADANITIGTTTVTTDENGTATVSLPAGEYTYTVAKEGTAETDSSTGSITVAADDAAKSIVAKLDTAAAMADVTINYYLKDTTDAVPTLAAATVEKVIGDTVTADDLTLAEVRTETDKYTYDSTSVELPYTVVDGENVINVYFVQADKYTGNIVTSTGVVIKSFSDVIAGDTVTYSNSMYLTDANGKVTAKADSNSFTTSVTPTADGDITVPYTAYEGTAYFAEGEALNNNSALASANYSGGSAQRATNYGDTAFTVAEAGTYKITVAGSCRNTNNNSVFSVYKNVAFTTSTETAEDGTETTVYTEVPENLIFNGDFKGASQNTVQTQGTLSTTEDVVLAAGDVIILAGDNGQSWIDYILVERTGDVPVEASIDSAVAVVATYPESEDYEGVATALSATFTITGNASFNYVTFTVGEGSAEGAVTTVSGDGTQAVYGIVVNALVEAADVTATASMTE